MDKLNSSVTEINGRVQQIDSLIKMSHNIQANIIGKMREELIRCMPRKELDFRIGLVEHCNLNCAGCDHFSPLAEPQFADLEETERSFARLAELFGRNVSGVSVQGGEPLLHPKITEFLVMTRKIFPEARIYIVTNGLKLLSMSDEFWNVCREERIEISPTKYPISVNYDAAEIKAKSNGIKYSYFNAGEQVKTMFKLPLDLEGRQDGRRSFISCHRANDCFYLQNGRLYTCTVAPTARHFDKNFGTHLFDEETNSIDIHEANSAQEIMEFLAKPIPFCRYCKIGKMTYGIAWSKSRKDIDEWT